MERRRRVVVVNLVRFVRDLQKHVTRTVHRVSSEQSTGRRGWFVHRGAFLFAFCFFSFVSLSLFIYPYLFFVRVSIASLEREIQKARSRFFIIMHKPKLTLKRRRSLFFNRRYTRLHKTVGELRSRVSLRLHLQVVETAFVLSVVSKRVGVYEDGEDTVTGVGRKRLIELTRTTRERKRERGFRREREIEWRW